LNITLNEINKKSLIKVLLAVSSSFNLLRFSNYEHFNHRKKQKSLKLNFSEYPFITHFIAIWLFPNYDSSAFLYSEWWINSRILFSKNDIKRKKKQIYFITKSKMRKIKEKQDNLICKIVARKFDFSYHFLLRKLYHFWFERISFFHLNFLYKKFFLLLCNLFDRPVSFFHEWLIFIF
jgi:hypothetical protein